MEAAWQIMQLDRPDNFVIGTGEVHSVREFVDEAFAYVGLNPDKYVESSQQLFRPAQNSILKADISKANKTFGFAPRVRFKELVALMMEHDLIDLNIPRG